MHTNKLVIVSLLALGLAACAGVQKNVVKAAPPREAGCQLDVFFSADIAAQKGPSEELCTLNVKSSSAVVADKSIDGLVERAKPEACACGGDALIMMGKSDNAVGTSSQGVANFKVVRYLKGAEAPAAK
jgi:hypothetical protein